MKPRTPQSPGQKFSPEITVETTGGARAGMDETVSGIQVVPEIADPDAPAPAGLFESVGAPPARPRPRGKDRTDGYDRFEAGELAVVCSRYPFGRIGSVIPYPRGSRRAPKVVIKSAGGLALMKRRSPRLSHDGRVGFCHALQEQLSSRGYPIAPLWRHDGGSTALSLETGVYEVFDFVRGSRYDRDVAATEDAGRHLALLHRLLADFRSDYRPPASTYHAAAAVTDQLTALPRILKDEKLDSMCTGLLETYASASEDVDRLGLMRWPLQVIHGDWHPGNIVFTLEEPRGVEAVLDYDAARLAPRVIDVANGALQFSVTRKGDDPTEWPVELDESRFAAFVRGYDAVDGCLLSKAECEAIPRLMMEGLIAEAVVPIAATGKFGHVPGGVFLGMVKRKVEWLNDHTTRLTGMIL